MKLSIIVVVIFLIGMLCYGQQTENTEVIVTAISTGSVEQVDKAVTSSGSLTEDQKIAVLNASIYSGNTEIFNLLLDRHFFVPLSRNSKTVSPLFVAVDANRVEMVSLLLKRGASVDVIEPESGLALKDFTRHIGSIDMKQLIGIK